MSKAILICGKLCCGKTTYAAQFDAARLSCDELMRTLWPEGAGEAHDVFAARTQTYLLKKAAELVRLGVDVVLDWGPWTRAGRETVRNYFTQRGIPFELHYIHVDEAEWHRRIAKRNAAAGPDVYFVDEGLLAKFEARFEAPKREEVDVWLEGR